MKFLQKIGGVFRREGQLAQLIILNVALFLTINIGREIAHVNLVPYLELPVGGAAFLTKIWTLVTYMFSHASLPHIFFNMVLLYYAGRVFFQILGPNKLIYVYVMSGLVGAAILLLCGIIVPASFSDSTLIGASAAVMGVIMVMAIYAPNYSVHFFRLVHMPYKYFAALTFILSTIVDLSLNMGGKISHIGGAIFGLVYGYYLRNGTDLFNFAFFSRKKDRISVVTYQTIDDVYNENRVNSEKRMNELLDKISKSGYDSLTKKEKDELYRLSQRK